MMKTTTLFCIPYAGSSAAFYKRWKKYMKPSIRLYPIEMPGRGERRGESLYNSMEEAVNDFFHIIKKELKKTQYAFFAHSMGTVIAYELYRKIKKAGYGLPVHMFLSGRYPPHVSYDSPKISTLPDNELIRVMKKIGAAPEILYKKPALLRNFFPVFRSDIKILDNYKRPEDYYPFDCSLSVFFSKNDRLLDFEYCQATCDMNEWKHYTTQTFHQYIFHDGHFYIHSEMKRITGIINNTFEKMYDERNIPVFNPVPVLCRENNEQQKGRYR
jgi:medium-chain acyl-[acyl-carrier-protein] hydrolase